MVGFVRLKAKYLVRLWVGKDFRKVHLRFKEYSIAVPFLRIKIVKVVALAVDRTVLSILVEVVVDRIIQFPSVKFITIGQMAFIIRIKWSK
jgi:hypothetical protein